jgi:two-component system response regulator MtrA
MRERTLPGMEGRVLLVEDDPSIREITTLALEREGLRVTGTGDGRDALVRFRQGTFDLVILDIMLPSLDGLEVCRAIRKESGVPVIMLSARGDTVDVVVGLELGADDYVTKPFDVSELVARVKAALRRAAAPPAEQTISVGRLEIDPAAFRVVRDGRDVPLTATEFRLLLELARRPGQVFTRDLLLDRVWNYEYLGDSRLVDVAVQRLRWKVEDDPKNPRLIQTVRGVGYRLAPR